MAVLLVIVNRVLGDRENQRLPPQEDHLIQTLRLDRLHKPLRVRVHVRRQVRREQGFNAVAGQDRLELGREDRIPIYDEETLPR